MRKVRVNRLNRNNHLTILVMMFVPHFLFSIFLLVILSQYLIIDKE